MIGIFICCFAMLLFCAFIKWRTEEDWRVVYWGIYLILTIMATNRDGRFADYDTYVLMYEDPLNTFVEPSFVAIASFAQWSVASPWMMFLIYASLGIFLKMKAILQMSDFPFFSLLFYYSNFYFLHDMVQMRVAVATGFMLLSIVYLRDKNIKQYLLCLVAAVAFHYSAIVMLSFLFISRDRFRLWLWFGITLVCVTCYVSGITLTSFLDIIGINGIQRKLLEYATVKNRGLDEAHLPIIRTGLVFIIFIFANKLCEVNRYAAFLIQVYIMSICVYMLFADIRVIAGRLGDFLAIVDFILIPMLIHIIKPKWMVYLFITVVSIYMFYVSITVGELIHEI